MRKLIWLVIVMVMLFACKGRNETAVKGKDKEQNVQIEETASVDVHDTMPVYNNQPHKEVISDYDYTAPYICPNHCPGSGSDKPGKCPVCGMDLIPNPDYQKEK